MWRLGVDISNVPSVGLAIDERELLWTEGAESIQVGEGFQVTYLPPARLCARVASLTPLTRDALDRRILSGAGRNVTREDVVERSAEVVEMLRWAAERGMGLLREFGP